MRQGATAAEIAANMAQHNVDTLADEMIELAARLRLRARGFTTNSRPASDVAADIVDHFTQGTGVLGSRLGSVVHNAGIADQARTKETEKQ